MIKMHSLEGKKAGAENAKPRGVAELPRRLARPAKPFIMPDAAGTKEKRKCGLRLGARWPSALIVAAWLAGCSPVDDHDHAGHDHAGHDHGAESTNEKGQLMCGEHGVPEAECGICQPDAVAGLKPGQSMKVRLPSPQSADAAGIATATPQIGPITDAVECYAEIDFNQNRVARVSASAGGIVREVLADLGAQVHEGDTLARIWSASIAEAMAKAVLTHQTLDRERRLHTGRITPQADLQEAEAAHRAACQQLRTLGFTEKQVDALAANPDEPVLLDIRAPFAGEVIERQATMGELVDVGRTLFTVADRSAMWAMLSIPEAALSRVRVGQSVELSLDALPKKTFVGRLAWIAAEVDERTRMARARAEMPDPGRELRANMYAKARVIVGRSDEALLLPQEAIQRVSGRPIVFVRAADDLFEARAVTLGARSGRSVQVTHGLRADDPVAISGSFAAKSQLLMSRLGAGCAHE